MLLYCFVGAVLPGSHTWPSNQVKTVFGSNLGPADPIAGSARDATVAQATMPKGSVLIYASSTLHAGGDNLSDEARWGLRLAYNLAFLRQEGTRM